MNYIAAAMTDKGSFRKVNQDSLCIKIADTDNHGQVVMAVICDGMGGFSKGELASATLVQSFSNWYENIFPEIINDCDMQTLSKRWQKMIAHQNDIIMRYGTTLDIKLGTTISALLIIDNKYMIMHVGDSRIYKVSDTIEQLTVDHTLVAREVLQGKITADEAKHDKRKHVLLQCVGASKIIEPHVVCGEVDSGDIFFMCSDGLYNTFDDEEILNIIVANDNKSVGELRSLCSLMIESAKSNGERDNISAAIIKCM